MPSPKSGKPGSALSPAAPEKTKAALTAKSGSNSKTTGGSHSNSGSSSSTKANSSQKDGQDSSSDSPDSSESSDSDSSSSKSPSEKDSIGKSTSSNQCEMVAFSYTCEHKGRSREANPDRELWVVPTAGGDVLQFKPTMADGPSSCVKYEVYKDGVMVNTTSSPMIKVDQCLSLLPDRTLINPLWEMTPVSWSVQPLDKAGYSGSAKVKAYPDAKDSISYDSKDLFDFVAKFLCKEIIALLTKITGKEFSLGSDGVSIKVGAYGYINIKAPNLTFKWEAQWVECTHDDNKDQWWMAYCKWHVTLNMDPLLDVGISVDLGAWAVDALAPGLSMLIQMIAETKDDTSDDSDPPIYAKANGKITASVDIQKAGPDRIDGEGNLTGTISAEIGIKIDKWIATAEGKVGGDLVKIEAKLIKDKPEREIVFQSTLTGPELKASFSVKTKFTSKWFKWVNNLEQTKEFVLLEPRDIKLADFPLIPADEPKKA